MMTYALVGLVLAGVLILAQLTADDAEEQGRGWNFNYVAAMAVFCIVMMIIWPVQVARAFLHG
jgi:hypothetical protein